jgi:carbon storage regulator CsrA
MLVLSRRLNQAIVIGGEVRVTVLAITPSRVELGVEAPREVMVDREEIHVKRQRNVEVGSGNVFAELGSGDVAELKAKMALAVAIKREIGARGWSPADVARVLEISQAQGSALLSYRLEGFSLGLLTTFLQAVTAARRPKNQ